MKRNWSYILSLPCHPTQLALATCSDECVLARLRHSFPEAFEEGEEETVGPWSMIRAEWEKHNAREYRVEPPDRLLYSAWGEAVDVPFCLQFGKFGGNERTTEFNKDGPVPEEVLKQLDQLTESWGHSDWFTAPIIIRYLEREWVVSYICADNGGMWGLPHDDGDGEVYLVPKEHIIFDI